MDEPKTAAIPALVPWAATACLAALLACVGELWVIEKARNQLALDENRLAESALKSAQNQLEAERILGRRELAETRARLGMEGALRVAVLSPPGTGPSDTPAPGRPWGVVVWESPGKRALLWLSGMPSHGAGRDYQLWIDGASPGYPAASVGFHGVPPDDQALPIELGAPATATCRFVLVDGPSGGARSLGEAVSRGVIILASPPPPGKIAN
jgi:hypothetical protein